MKRRSFFKALARAIAIVAIAPELCFRAKLALPALPSEVFLHSIEWTAVIEHPTAMLVIDNFGDNIYDSH